MDSVTENVYSVYYHKNTINNKYYVGQTKLKPEDRWRGGRGYKNNKHFFSAIKKYGWDAFEHVVVAQGLSKEESDAMEIKLIKEYDSTNPERGYNYAIGGGGASGKHYWSSFSGKKHTEESLERIRKKAKERRDPVVCLELNKTFSCAQEAADSVPGTFKSGIGKCCRHVGKTCGGFHWVYLTEFNQHEKDYWSSFLCKATEGKKKPVVCLETGVVYKCAKNAAEAIGLSRKCICDACNGRRKSGGEFHWCYLEEYNQQGDDA